MKIGDGARVVYYRIWVAWWIWVAIVVGALLLSTGCATKLTSAHRVMAEDLGVTNDEMLVLVKEDNKRKCSTRKYTPVSDCYQKPAKPPEYVGWHCKGVDNMKMVMKSRDMKHSPEFYCYCSSRFNKHKRVCKGV